MINSDTLKVLLIDPAFSTQGKGESQGDTLLNASVPLSVGLLGSYMKSKIPEIEVKILKASYNIIKYIDEEQPQIRSLLLKMMPLEPNVLLGKMTLMHFSV